ncbi:hypothetical protein IMG5_160870 [Ichthyophthirius multifiliis]|uniref:EF-hand domain-containing protein n=1 Tax=Ichthyophthirius multifiliis TaxID=5932 RepID=G0QZZ7_ICHMU|nr:hypothetical protein IMG5_160870 [Ichthyophthirius multifiliis]EGR29207.1 hypothetical protein IMG5_160870 [Ichthyophthirius multifiliis]|eukprot:XP_004030443.1 hypothetical protein IMG5_160870 [Ichthyophthirius multifiliis]
MKDILMTAQTLGLDEKYSLVFKILTQIQEHYEQEQEQNNRLGTFDFETFILYLTQYLGNTVTQEGRESLFSILDKKSRNFVTKDELKQTADELRYNIGDQEIEEIVQNVAGFGQQGFNFEKFDKYVARKVERKNIK